MTIDPAAIRETERLGPRSFSPYANRSFLTRPLWGDQHVHSGWSFDAGFINALSPEDALRFARGEQVETTYGVPIQLSRPLDWLAMTDHSDLIGVPPALRKGDPALVEADPTLAAWSEVMQNFTLDEIVPVAMAAIQAQGNGTLPEAAKGEELFRDTWHDYTGIIERFNEPGRFTALIGYEWTPNPGPGKGVPMGGALAAAPEGKAPSFLVAALRDPIGGNLDRIQIIKGWVNADGKTEEKLYDVAWSGDREPGPDGKLPPVGDTVDVENATWTNSIGAPELIAVRQDPDFDPSLPAMDYARVLQIPTPRWTAYEQQRFQIKMADEVPMTTQERAYTSPIWYRPAS